MIMLYTSIIILVLYYYIIMYKHPSGYDSIYVTCVVEYYNNSNMANRDSLLLQILKALSVRNAILVIYNI
jgi:hypothetical protein